MKKSVIFIIVIITLFWAYVAQAEEIYSADKGISRESIENIHKILPEFSFEEATKELLQGEYKGAVEEIFENIKKTLLGEVHSAFKFLGAIIVIGTVCALMSGFQSGFLSDGVKHAVDITCSLLILGILASSFKDVTELAKNVTNDMSLFMMAALPSLGGLGIIGGTISSGGTAAMAVYAVGITGMIIRYICLPAIHIALAMSLAGSVSTRFSLKDISAIIRKSALWIMGGAVTVSASIISVSSFAAASLGTAATKGVKFAVSSLVPVLGGALTDAAETVVGSARLLKSAAGAAGMIFIILILIYPVIKMAVIAFMYKATGALLSVVAEKKVSETVSDMGDIASTLAGILVFDGAGMIIMVAAVIKSVGGGAL